MKDEETCEALAKKACEDFLAACEPRSIDEALDASRRLAEYALSVFWGLEEVAHGRDALVPLQ